MKNQLMIFGIHAVTTSLERNPQRITEVYLLQDRQDKILTTLAAQAKQHRLPVHYLSKKALDELTQSQQHQGAAIRCLPLPTYSVAPTLYA